MKLSNDDRCAIDVVLEQRAAGDGKLPHCFGKQTASLQKRIKKVERLFDLLALWPAQEPPATLVADTIKYVQRHAHDVTATDPAARRAAIVSHASSHRSLH